MAGLVAKGSTADQSFYQSYLKAAYVADDAKRAALEAETANLKSIVVCSQAAANAVMLGTLCEVVPFLDGEQVLDKLTAKFKQINPKALVSVKLVAEAPNGAFCLLPRHVDFVAALVPGLTISRSRTAQNAAS